MQRGRLKILLLQIRENPEVCKQEHQCFAEYSQLEPHQIDILNVCRTPEFDPSVIDQYDALFVGGSSNVSVLEPEKYPFVKPCQDLLNDCCDMSKPVFASCFGFQLAVMAFGGEIVRQEEGFEMGTVAISLTKCAEKDPVMQDTPDGFMAVSVHQEKAVNLPEMCRLLAYTDQCCHAFVVGGKPFWAFQFHPEVDRDILIKRLAVYQEKYTKGPEHYHSLLDRFTETPFSNLLLKKFVDYLQVRTTE